MRNKTMIEPGSGDGVEGGDEEVEWKGKKKSR